MDYGFAVNLLGLLRFMVNSPALTNSYISEWRSPNELLWIVLLFLFFFVFHGHEVSAQRTYTSRRRASYTLQEVNKDVLKRWPHCVVISHRCLGKKLTSRLGSLSTTSECYIILSTQSCT